jgi:hypothetical protein
MLRSCPGCGTTEVIPTGHGPNCQYQGKDISEILVIDDRVKYIGRTNSVITHGETGRVYVLKDGLIWVALDRGAFFGWVSVDQFEKVQPNQ